MFSINPNITLRFKRDQKTLPLARKPQAQLYNHNEYHNLASDYMYGKTNKHAETPELTLDQYIALVRAFKMMAQTIDLPCPPPLDTDAMIDSAISGDITHIPASSEDFVRSYENAQLQERP